jgi:hypothetical protein
LALGADRVRKSPLTVDAVGWTIRNATWPVFPEGKLLKTKRPKRKRPVENAAAVEIDKGCLRRFLLDDSHSSLNREKRPIHSYHSPDGGT